MPLSPIQQQAILYTRLGDPEKLASLIEQDETLLECRDEDNNTLLLLALKHHHLLIAVTLFQCGAKLNVANVKRMTPLHYAIKREYFELARSMLVKPNGVRVNDCNTKGESALMLLAQKGCLETAQCLQSKYPDVNLKNSKGQTAFAIAVYFHQFDFADSLLHHHADINTKDNNGNTPLHNAVIIQDEAAIHFLTSRGAAIRINNKEQLSPLDIVAYKGLIELTELLRRCDKRDPSNEPSLFLWAASRGYVGILKSLLEEEVCQPIEQICSAPLVEVQRYEDGSENTANIPSVIAAPVMQQEAVKYRGSGESKALYVNAEPTQVVGVSQAHMHSSQTLICQVNHEGETALFIAVKHKQEKTVEFLMENHAEVDLYNHEHKTPLMIAVENYYSGIVRLLIQGGADLSLCNAQGQTAARMAFNLESSKCALEFYRHIRALGQKIDETDINAQERKILSEIKTNHYIENPVILAVQQQQYDEVERLLQDGADVSDVDQQGRSALYHAATKRSLSLVGLLIQHGADVNGTTEQNDTALMVATRQGHIELVQFLMDKKVNLVAKHSDGTTALEMAVHHKQMIIAEMILTRLVLLGLEIPAFKHQSNKTKAIIITEREYPIGLIDAAIKDDVVKAEMLLDQGAVLDVRNARGETPLHVACRYGHLNMISFLISRGADPSLLNAQRYGMVHFAAAYDQVQVLMYLEQHNLGSICLTDDKPTKDYYQPIHLAAKNGAEQALRYILEKAPNQVNAVAVEGTTPLHLAAAQGNTSCCLVLVWYGASLVAEDDNKRTPLIRALLQDRDECSDYLYGTMIELGLEPPKNQVRIIQSKLEKVAKRSSAENLLHKFVKANDADAVLQQLQRGAVIHYRDENKRTALFYALENRNDQIVQLLKTYGADINEKDPDGLTYAMIASRNGELSYLEYLILLGADVMAESKLGNIALFYAVHHEHPDVVSYLLQLAPQAVHHVNMEGWNAIFFAACKLQHEMIEQFIVLGANQNVVDNDGHNLLLHAATYGLSELLKKRISNGDDLTKVDKYHKSALHLALEAEENSSECCKYLILAMNNQKIEIPEYLQSDERIKKIGSDILNFKKYCLSNFRNGASLDAILKYSRVEFSDTVLDDQDKANIFNQVTGRLHFLFEIKAPIVSHIDNQLTKLGSQNQVTINVLMVLDKILLELEQQSSELSTESIEIALLREAKNKNSELHQALKGNTSMTFFSSSKGRNRSLSLEKVVSNVTTSALKETAHTVAIVGAQNISFLGEAFATDDILKQNLFEKLRLDFSNAQHREFWAGKVRGGGGVVCEGVRVPKTISKLREHITTYSSANYASILSSLKDILKEEQRTLLSSFFSSKGMVRSDEVTRLIRDCENLENIDFSVEAEGLRSPSL